MMHVLHQLLYKNNLVNLYFFQYGLILQDQLKYLFCFHLYLYLYLNIFTMFTTSFISSISSFIELIICLTLFQALYHMVGLSILQNSSFYICSFKIIKMDSSKYIFFPLSLLIVTSAQVSECPSKIITTSN